MCGIAGILELDRSKNAPAEVLESMLRAIVHRGPDEDGRLVDRELAFGMRRLSIIDLSDGTQPIFDESGRYAVVFNGEIYNYRELRDELTGRGHQFKTQSDTEVIVHLFEEHGPACVESLRGMFGLAVWDNVKRELFVARDRLGIKPLYFTVVDGSLVFASEIKAILEHPSVHAKLDLEAASQYLSLKYTPAPNTLFEGVQSLEPGHMLLVRDGQVSQQAYWELPTGETTWNGSEEEAIDELGRILRESVRLRLRADVPFGAFLSGGVDSSVIVALMAEQLSSPVKTFSVGFAGAEGQDELPYARQVADRFGCEYHSLEIGARDFLEHAEQVLWHLDQPIADQATVATHMVAKLARENVKMVLTGEGGDELFAGYARYAGERYSRYSKYLPGWAGAGLRRMARWAPGLRRAKIAVNALSIRDDAHRMANWFPMFADDAKQRLLSGHMAAYCDGAASVFARHFAKTDSGKVTPLQQMLRVDSRLWLPDYLLLRGDKLTMANSLEARVPLLDHHLVEFASGLPDKFKLNGGTRKYLLKKFAATLLPDSIIHRKKQGFPIPIDRWLRAEANGMMRDLLSTATLERRGLFQPETVAGLIRAHEAGYADYSTELWGLMSLEMWMRRFVDHSLSVGSASPGATTLAGTSAEGAPEVSAR